MTLVVDDAALIAAYRQGVSASELGRRYDMTSKTVLNRLARAGVSRRPRGRPRRLTALEDRTWLAREYGSAGRTAAELAAELRCSETAVLEALYRHGIAVRGRGGGTRRAPMPPQLRDEEWLRRRYAAGGSIRGIAAELGVSGSAVANALRRAGIARRPAGSTRASQPAEPEPLPPLRRRGSRAVGMLADGTEFYVPLGRLDFVDDGTRVLCHLCGEPFRLLSATHLRGHGWTPADYRLAFGLNRGTPLCAPTVSEQRRAAGRDRYATNARVREGMARGQQLVRSGEALMLAQAAAPAGSARLQRRLHAAEVTASSRRQRQAETAARRRDRIRELGFATERAYLRDRYVRRGWGVARIKTELRVGSGVVERLLDAAGIARRPPGGAR